MATSAEVLTRMTAKDEVTRPLARAQKGVENYAKAGRQLNGTMRQLRGMSGQFGHQIQDVAVQLQMGTSALTVFGQQGSQIAAIFGPQGAMIGAFLAVGAAVAGPLMNALNGGTGALEKLKEEAIGAEPVLARLNGALQEQARISVRANLKELYIAQAKASNQLAEAQEKLSRATRVKELFGDFARVNNEIETQSERIRELEAALEAVAPEIKAVEDNFRGLDPAITRTNEKLQEEIQLFGANAVEVAIYKAALDGVITSQEQETIALTEQLMKLRENIEAEQEAVRLATSEEKAKDKVTASIERMNGKLLEEHIRLSGGQVALELYRASLLGLGADSEAVALILANNAERVRVAEAKLEEQRLEAEQKEAQRKRLALARQKEQDKTTALSMANQFANLETGSKKMFRIQKAFGIAAATISTFEAVNNALALKLPPPIPQVMAGVALTTGLANVAQIKAQSFEGGGFTGRGARAGGLDGKGGRMAMVHPNETVIDHTKGGVGGITVINNVDARGSGADVDQKIKFAMAQSSQQTIMTIQDLMRRRRFV